MGRAGWSALALRTACLALAAQATSGAQPGCEPRSFEYRRLRFAELCGLADAIAAGTIRSLDARTFALETEWSLPGSGWLQGARILRFEDWTCAQRWEPYAEGQRVLLFLARGEGAEPTWTILGAGGEGELPLSGDRVLARDYILPGFPSERHAVGSASLQGTLVPLAELASAIELVRAACEQATDEGDRPCRILRARAGEAPMQACLSGSPLARYLALDLMSSESWRGRSSDSGVELSSDAVLLVPASDLGLTGPARWRARARSEERRSELGASAAVLGDVNRDGNDDLAVGAPGDCLRAGCRGTVWILFLDTEGQVLASQEIGQLDVGIDLELSEEASFGAAVAAVGDVDFDGVPDLAVGAPKLKDERGNRGRAWILLLREDGTVKDARVDLGLPQATSVADSTAAHWPGSALSVVGDLDGDGCVELAVGGFHSHPWPQGEASHLLDFVSVGRSGIIVRRTRLSHGAVATGEGSCELGSALCALGDVDEDGIPDLALSDPDAANRGRVWILFLDAAGAVKRSQAIDSWSGGFEGLLRDGSRFGSALAGPGDLDGDGTPDLLVGSAEGLWLLSLRADGTVARHRSYRLPREVGDRGRPPASIAASRSSARPDRVRVVLGGSTPGSNRDPAVLWLFALDREGALTAW